MTEQLPGGFGAGILDLLAHAARAHRKPAWPAEALRTAKGGARIVSVAARPFGTLIRFARDDRERDPRVLVVAPWSGHFGALLYDLVNGLLPDHDVYLTDWSDAAAVPREAGDFGLDDMIEYVAGFLRRIGPEVHVVGMSQACVPIVAAAALMAEAGDGARPRSMTLMGGLIDTRLEPTGMNRMARAMFGTPRAAALSRRALIRPAAAGLPGAGRAAYPAGRQFAGLALYLLRRLRPAAPTPLHVFQKSLIGDGAPAAERRFLYDTFLTLMDVPAALYLETMAALFRDDALARGRMTWRGRAVATAAIAGTALMTVEAERDDISGRGQTRAAHGLCPNIPEALRAHHFEPRIGHLGMFHGRRWRDCILPLFRRFVRRVS